MFVDELDEFAEFVVGDVRGRTPIRPSFGRFDQPRRHAVFSAIVATALPAKAQKLRLFSD